MSYLQAPYSFRGTSSHASTKLPITASSRLFPPTKPGNWVRDIGSKSLSLALSGAITFGFSLAVAGKYLIPSIVNDFDHFSSV